MGQNSADHQFFMKNETFFHREVLHLHNNSLFTEILLTLY
ncbi:hypothetical protein M081_4534, partial [Bacteroides fragilis str. 3998 T(B) 4]